MMYGQMTAGSWIYIGSQGIVQGTYETFVEMGRQHYGGDLTGKWILTAGLGGMGGAQPLAASLAGACSLNIECQQSRIDMRLKHALRRRTGRRPRRRARAHRQVHEGRRSEIDRAARQRRRNPAATRRARRAPGCGHRPDQRARSGARLPADRLDAWSNGSPTRSSIRKKSATPPSSRCACTSKRCSRSRSWASPRSTTATTSARWRRTKAARTRSISPASSRPTCVRCSAAASARSAGWRCPAIRKTSTRPTPRSRN